MIATKSSMGRPIGLCAKEWTLATIPLRVLNVPRMTSKKVRITRNMFQTFNMPRFS